MTPPADTPSSSGQGERVSLEWSSIQGPAGSVMLRKREENKQKNMRAQRTSRESKKYGGFCNSASIQRCPRSSS